MSAKNRKDELAMLLIEDGAELKRRLDEKYEPLSNEDLFKLAFGCSLGEAEDEARALAKSKGFEYDLADSEQKQSLWQSYLMEMMIKEDLSDDEVELMMYYMVKQYGLSL